MDVVGLITTLAPYFLHGMVLLINALVYAKTGKILDLHLQNQQAQQSPAQPKGN